jgi:uncharacterized membrane protein YdjX (TVP38/TMEM64 family)
MRWLWLTLAVVVAILIPFFLFEDYFNTLAARAAGGELSTSTAVAVIGGLLALDVFLPVPSSIVSGAAGVLLGFGWGTLVIWAGMTVSCVIGYLVGARSARLAQRLVGAEGLERAADAAGRYGLAALAFCRPVPVLAEASVVMAGMMRVPLTGFVAVCLCSNLGVALVYAAIGAWSMSVNSFLLAFAGAMAFPSMAWLAARIWSGRLRSAVERSRDEPADRQ